MKIGRFTGPEQENVRWKGYFCYFIAGEGWEDSVKVDGKVYFETNNHFDFDQP